VPGAGHSLKGVAQRARREWRVRAQAALDDPGMTFAEVLAWVGDLLSDYAERLANEAYLGSARDGWLAGRRARAELGIGIEIERMLWRQVPNLDRSGSDDRHYVVRRGSDGVTLVEFGDGVHGQAPSSGSAIGVRYRAGTRYSSVLLQQGRVMIDTDAGEAPPVMACGIYRATVTRPCRPWRACRRAAPTRSPASGTGFGSDSSRAIPLGPSGWVELPGTDTRPARSLAPNSSVKARSDTHIRHDRALAGGLHRPVGSGRPRGAASRLTGSAARE